MVLHTTLLLLFLLGALQQIVPLVLDRIDNCSTVRSKYRMSLLVKRRFVSHGCLRTKLLKSSEV